MEHSILSDILTAKVLASFVEAWKPEQSPIIKYLPYKAIPTLTYKTVLGQEVRPMADVVAYDADYPQKRREVLGKITGDIPALRVIKKMDEVDLNNYGQFLAMKDVDINAVMDLVFGDVQYCYAGCLNRLSYLGFQALSTGIIALDGANNAGIVTEEDIDFQIPADNKSGASVLWDAEDISTTKPITDIIAITNTARDAGVILKRMLMSRTTFSYLRRSQETINLCFGQSGVGVTKLPNVALVNENLVADGLPSIDIIDSFFQFENALHDITNLQAWDEGKVAFLPQDIVGSTLHCRTAEEQFPPKQVTQTKKDVVLISKWSEVAPIKEFTAGAVNGFPSIALVNQIRLLNTLNVTDWE